MSNISDKQICGRTIQFDYSGIGHNWITINADTIPAAVREEIEGEIIDGKKVECDLFVASNGQRYRWGSRYER